MPKLIGSTMTTPITTTSFCNAKSILSQYERAEDLKFAMTSPFSYLRKTLLISPMPTKCLLKCPNDAFSLRRSPPLSPSSCGGSAVRHHISRFGVAAVAAAAAQPSRMARAEAQHVLLDYLYETSALHFPDAEHISKNSPKFLNRLISMVAGGGDQKDVGRGIRRFLLYHPINEFEPFFESLGMKESDISRILPYYSNIFLRDDETLLENYHLLCNYGMPRSRIGKIFLEAPHIFGFKPSDLMARLKSYQDLGLSIPAIIKLVSCSPSLLTGDGVDPDFAHFFRRMTDLGFQDRWITWSLSESNTYHWGKVMQTLEFLLEMGCSEGDVRLLIRRHPWFLFNESGKKVHIVSAILTKLGMEMDMILSILLHNPQIMSGSFLKNLYHSILFLSGIGMREEEIASIVISHPNSMGRCMFKTPGYVLSRSDIEPRELCDIIRKDPRQLVNLAAKSKTTTKLASSNRAHPLEKTEFLVKLGFVENSDEMVVAQKRFRGCGDQLRERFEALVSAGLSYQNACDLVRAAPQVLNQTVHVLEKKIDYLINCRGYPLESLVRFPEYLSHNLDGMKARFSMIQWLKEKDLVKRSLSPSSIVASSRARFERSYVNLLPEGRGVWTRLNQSCS